MAALGRYVEGLHYTIWVDRTPLDRMFENLIMGRMRRAQRPMSCEQVKTEEDKPKERIRCPNCGSLLRLFGPEDSEWKTLSRDDRQLVHLCDSEDGGCDRIFRVRKD